MGKNECESAMQLYSLLLLSGRRRSQQNNGDFFAAKEATRLTAASSTREKNRTKEEYLRMMLFMIRPENLHLMTAALGTHETRKILDKEAMYGRYDPQVLTYITIASLYPHALISLCRFSL
jgi:hypothetical protein